MQYWLMKSEPGTWSWEDQCNAPNRTAEWDGVRNHQAAKHMRNMKVGDYVFFYHSGKSREVVGVVEVVKEFYPDPSDESGKFGMVDVKAIEPLDQPVSLKQIKAEESLQHLALVRQSRLSVMPIDEESWEIIHELGGM